MNRLTVLGALMASGRGWPARAEFAFQSGTLADVVTINVARVP